jgi:hypothetical protein
MMNRRLGWHLAPLTLLAVLAWGACGDEATGFTAPLSEACGQLPPARTLPAGTRRGACSPGLTLSADGHCRGWRANPNAGPFERGTATLLSDDTLVVIGMSWRDGVPHGLAQTFDLCHEAYTALSDVTPRWGHTATFLADGAVLVVGGATEQPLADVTRVDVRTARAAPLSVARWGHTTTALGDGRALIAGGVDTAGHALASFEVHPARQDSRADGRLATARALHTATALPDGGVILVGGEGADGTAIASTERFDPTSETFFAAAPLATPRRLHDAATLANGLVLVAGGLAAAPLADARIYDPASDTWRVAAPLPTPRAGLRLTTLCDGSVIATGGFTDDGAAITEVVRYRLEEDRWAPFGALKTPRREHAAVLLPDGGVAVVGGLAFGDAGVPGVERNVVETAAWRTTATLLPGGRTDHTTTALRDGRVLVVGGLRHGMLSDTAIFAPLEEVWRTGPPLDEARRGHTTTALEDGGALVVGGARPDLTPIASAARFDPAADAWRPVAAPREARGYHVAAPLADGRVLIAGGIGARGAALTSAEVYDPRADTWQTVAPLRFARTRAAAVALPDGRVFVVGGVEATAAGMDARRAEFYDPATNRWRASEVPGANVISPSPVVLPSGRVLLVPYGSDPSQLIDPATGNSKYVARGATDARPGLATLLPCGDVLLVDARGDGPTGHAWRLAGDPLIWRPTGGLVVPRSGFTLTLLDDGRALVVGGVDAERRHVGETEIYTP